MAVTSKKNDKALANFNNKVFDLMNDRCIIASYLLSPLSKITNPENTSHFKLVKDPQSNRINDLLINKTMLVTLYDKILTFRDTDKKFELEGDLLKMMTNKNYNVDLAKLPDKKLMFEFSKEMYFDEKAVDNNSTRDKSLTKLLQ